MDISSRLRGFRIIVQMSQLHISYANLTTEATRLWCRAWLDECVWEVEQSCLGRVENVYTLCGLYAPGEQERRTISKWPHVSWSWLSSRVYKQNALLLFAIVCDWGKRSSTFHHGHLSSPPHRFTLGHQATSDSN